MAKKEVKGWSSSVTVDVESTVIAIVISLIRRRLPSWHSDTRERALRSIAANFGYRLEKL